MKTERRHELQTNWLADRVGDFIVVVKPYAKGVAGILLACLVVWLAMLYKAHRSEAEQAEGWNKLWDGLRLSGLQADEVLVPLSETNSTHPSGEWALLILADDNLTSGVGALFTEKAVGRNQIKTALDNYKSVLTSSTDSLLREHALYGVGRAQESLCKVQEAETAYKQLRSDYPNGSYFARAKERLDDLARESTVARYDWFANLEPPSNVFGKGSDKSGLQLPSDLEPFSQFTTPAPKTPPAEPKPDTGAPAAKDSKTGDVKSPDTKTPEKSKPADKAGETNPVAPKPSDAKATDTPPTSATPTTGPTLPTATPAVPAPTTPAPTVPTPTVPTPDDSKTTPPKSADNK